MAAIKTGKLHPVIFKHPFEVTVISGFCKKGGREDLTLFSVMKNTYRRSLFPIFSCKYHFPSTFQFVFCVYLFVFETVCLSMIGRKRDLVFVFPVMIDPKPFPMPLIYFYAKFCIKNGKPDDQ